MLVNKIRLTIKALAFKQLMDFLRNKRTMLIFFIFPAIYIIANLISSDIFSSDGAAFILMYVILVPLLVMATLVAEEKEKGTLKLLVMSGVSSIEYFIGVTYVLLGFIIAGILIFDMAGATKNFDDFIICIFMLVVSIISMQIGAIIGRMAKNQTNVAPIAVPTVLVLFFLPNIELLRPSIDFFSKYFFTGILFKVMNTCNYSANDILWMAVNFLIVLLVFIKSFNTKSIIRSISA